MQGIVQITFFTGPWLATGKLRLLYGILNKLPGPKQAWCLSLGLDVIYLLQ